MQMPEEAMNRLRVDLSNQIDAIAMTYNKVGFEQLCHSIDQVRSIASEFGIVPVADLARALEANLATCGKSAMTLAYLEMMRDASACRRLDSDASTAYLAVLGSRYGGQ